jgi:hypothetical protein
VVTLKESLRPIDKKRTNTPHTGWDDPYVGMTDFPTWVNVLILVTLFAASLGIVFWIFFWLLT